MNRMCPPLSLLALALPALALPAAGAAGTRTTLEIKTVPSLPAVNFELGPARFSSGPDGVARVVYDGSVSSLRQLRVTDSKIVPGVRATFGRWYGNRTTAGQSRLTAALNIHYRVRFAFTDRKGHPIDRSRVTLLALRGRHGVTRRFGTKQLQKQLRRPIWIHGRRVVSTQIGLQTKDIEYSVERVIVGGTNVVNRAQQRVFPSEKRRIEVELLFFSARFAARDALFKFPIGSGFRLRHPDGHWEELDFGPNAERVVSALPRGEYWVEVRGPGVSFLRPVSLSRDQEVNLEVLSFIDVAVAMFLVGGAALGLLFIGRPHILARSTLAWAADATVTLAKLTYGRPLAATRSGAATARAYLARGTHLAKRLLLLVVLLLAPAGSAAAQKPIPVLAYYYIWFDPTSWERAKTDYPLLGRYSSDERLVMQKHVRWAKEAGLDGFIVSWKSTSVLDRRLEELIEIAEAQNFKLVIIYQGLDFERLPLPVSRIATDLDHFITRFAHREPFDLFGKPVVIWSGTWKFSRADLASVTGPLRDRLLILASEKDVPGFERVNDQFDGNAYYWPSVDPVQRPTYWEKLVEIGDAVHAGGGLWIAPAAPGFDSRELGGSVVVARRSGETLRRSMDGAHRSSPDAVGVISWNEFSENTHVEPSERHGPRYLEILADIHGAQPRSLAELDSSDVATARQATDVAHGAPLLGGIIALGVVFMSTAIWRGRKRAASTRE